MSDGVGMVSDGVGNVSDSVVMVLGMCQMVSERVYLPFFVLNPSLIVSRILDFYNIIQDCCEYSVDAGMIDPPYTL